MTQIRTEKQQNGTVNVYTPYNRDFVAGIKRIGGARWNTNAKCWNIPEAGLEDARQMMQRCYGETDIPQEGQKMVTIRIRFDNNYAERCSGVAAFGKTLAVARGRDSGARVGEDAILEEGSITSGGSAKNWTTEIAAGSVFRITVPESIYKAEKDSWNVEVVEDAKEDRRAALIAEREKLLARLAEIEKELA